MMAHDDLNEDNRIAFILIVTKMANLFKEEFC